MAKRTLCALALVAGIVVPGVDVALAITPRSLPCENETLFLVRAVDPFFPSAVLLFLDPGDTGTGVQSVDSGALRRSGGNQWVSVGTWDLFSPKEACTLTGLGDVELWLGLRNSDDQGARFDVLVELLDDFTVIASGTSYCVSGVTRNPLKAKAIGVPFDAFSPVTISALPHVVSLRVSARMGTEPGGTCPGHVGATGLRLYFGDPSRDSGFAVTLEEALVP